MKTDRHDDLAVRRITEEQVMEHAEVIKVRETGPVSRERIAYWLVLGSLGLGAFIAVTTILTFAFLTYRDPKNAATHLDLCLKMFREVMSAIGGQSVLLLALGYLFGRQEAQKQIAPEADDKNQ